MPFHYLPCNVYIPISYRFLHNVWAYGNYMLSILINISPLPPVPCPLGNYLILSLSNFSGILVAIQLVGQRVLGHLVLSFKANRPYLWRGNYFCSVKHRFAMLVNKCGWWLHYGTLYLDQCLVVWGNYHTLLRLLYIKHKHLVRSAHLLLPSLERRWVLCWVASGVVSAQVPHAATCN